MADVPFRPVELAARPRARASGAPARPAPAAAEHFHANSARIEGVVTRVWTYDGDVYARVAIYDRHAETLAEGENGREAALPRRKAHYLSLWLPQGRTADGMAVSLQPKERVVAAGYLRDRAYSESLAHLLKKMERPDRLQPGDEQVFVGRSATYLVVESLIRLS